MSLRSLDMSSQVIKKALKPGASGKLSLQQIPYECPDESFEFVIESDLLEPTVVAHHSRASSKEKRQQAQTLQPTAHLADLDDQPLMAEPEFLRPPDFELPKAILQANLEEQVRYALTNDWKWDPMGWSAKAAVEVAHYRDLLSHEEYCRITKAKMTRTKKVRNLAWLEYERCRKQNEWLKNKDEDDIIFNFHCANLDQGLDEFYGSEGTDLRPVQNETDDEGFAEPDVIATTVVTLPDKSLLEPGVTLGGIFQDSGIVIDNDYAEYSRAHSRLNTANLSAIGAVPSDWPTFNANVASSPTIKRRPRLGLVGDQEQYDWPGRRQGPYGIDGLRAWVRASEKASSRHDVAASVEQNVRAHHYTDQVVHAPIVASNLETTLPAAVTPSINSLERAQRISEHTEREADHKPSELTPPLLGQEQPQHLPGNSNGEEQADLQEQPDEVTSSNTGAESSKAYEAAPHLVTQERPQQLDGSNEGVHDNRPSVDAPNTIQAIPRIEVHTDVHARHNTPTTAITTPVNQQMLQIEQVKVDTPATPATININLTPEYNSDMEDASDDSLEVHLPSSPTPNEHPSQPEGHAGFTKGVELHQKKSDALFTLSSPKTSQATSSSSKAAPIPTTPANETHSASFRPTTPFQIGTPAQNQDFNSPGTPTPAPKDSKESGKRVMNIFKSAKLASRSPERTKPSPDIVVAPFTPTARGDLQTRGSPLGSQGLLFNKAKKNEKNTMNVLNSLKLSPAEASGSFVPDTLDGSEDELASELGFEAHMGGNKHQTPEPRGNMRSGKSTRGASAKRDVAQAVVVPSVRRRRGNEGGVGEDVQSGEPKKKKQRRSLRSGAGSADVGPDH